MRTTSWPSQFQCSSVSTTEKPVTDAAETDVKTASTTGVRCPDLVTPGSAKNMVPTSEMMTSPDTKNWAWRRAFVPDSGAIDGGEEIGGPADCETRADERLPNTLALAVGECVNRFIETRNKDDVPFLQHFVARRTR